MTTVEWVYIDSNNDEPHVLEADSAPRAKPSHSIRLDEDVAELTVEPEDSYFGDMDSGDDKLVDAADAFEIFTGRRFPTTAPLDFSDILSCDDPASRNLKTSKPRKDHAKLPLESRSERIERLQRELSEISTNDNSHIVAGAADAGEAQIDELRQTLDRLSMQFAHTSHVRPTPLLLRTDRQNFSPVICAGDQRNLKSSLAHNTSGSTVMQIFSHDAVATSSLDVRITALERQIAPGMDSGAEGLWRMVAAVRAHLDAADSTSLEELRASVETLAAAMAGAEPVNISDVADAGSLLRKLDDLEPMAAAVPTVTARLRSIKDTLDDASGIARAITELSARCDALVSSRTENIRLISQVEDNLAANLRTVQNNMDALHTRLSAALELKPESN
jgi:Dynamitin